MKAFVSSLIVLALAGLAFGAELRTDHVTVNYRGVEEPQAQAIARVIERARQVASDDFAFDMPAAITATVDCNPKNTVRLFTDGSDHVTLSIRTPADLRPPKQSGIFNLYGMCHELGHMAMYRAIKNHDFLTTAAAEGWAHYVGSRIVDRVFEAEGEKAWFEPYDYRADGMQRLNAQLNNPNLGRLPPVAQGAGLWKQLAEIIGDKQLAALLKAWGAATIDPADPAAALAPALEQVGSDARVAGWWKTAQPVLILKRERSDFAAKTIPPAQLSGKPTELALDDGKSGGQMSVAGGGHAVVFDAPGEEWYLTSVKIYGARYGTPQAPRENFKVWLCDADGKPVREFAFPYSSFARGAAQWVTLKTEPTCVPRKFMICVGFNPTATKGVYAHYDAQRDHDAKSGLPGGEMRDFARGDWMIRAMVDQPKAADALK